MANKREEFKTKTVILKKHIKHALWDGLRIEQKIVNNCLDMLTFEILQKNANS